MRILLMGPQGSGKGTIGKMIAEATGYLQIVVGDALRSIPETNPHYNEVKEAMDKGELVHRRIVTELIKEKVKESPDKYLIDGWGRSLEDLAYYNPGFDKVLYLNISDETAVKRLTGRRICKNSECNWTCNINAFSEDSNISCDRCLGELYQREDDTEEAVKRRLDIFHNETKKVIKIFKDQEILIEIDAEGTPQENFELALSALNIKND